MAEEKPISRIILAYHVPLTVLLLITWFVYQLNLGYGTAFDEPTGYKFLMH
jgi:hypothetical protein